MKLTSESTPIESSPWFQENIPLRQADAILEVDKEN